MYRNTFPGKFIVFEGLDGSGQSTQVKHLTEYLEKKGKSVLATKEPTTTSEPGKEIGKALTHQIVLPSDDLQKLFSEDRRLHIETVILPALQEGKIVLSDRYFLSSLAFGSIDCDLAWLKEINNAFLIPDITFILKVRAEVSLGRILGRGKDVELFEKKEKLEKVVLHYEALAKQYDRCIVVDGEQPPEVVHAEIRTYIDPLLS